MSGYIYELPTTGAISFGDFCLDPSGSYTTQLADATQARANLRAALKESKRTDGEKDNLRLVKVNSNVPSPFIVWLHVPGHRSWMTTCHIYAASLHVSTLENLC
jgi:hypothetical protein